MIALALIDASACRRNQEDLDDVHLASRSCPLRRRSLDIAIACAGFNDRWFVDANGEVAGLDYDRITPLLLEAVKAQQKLIASLEERLRKLERESGLQGLGKKGQ